MISRGRIQLSAPLDEIMASHCPGGRQQTLDEIFVEHAGKSVETQE
jgi:hypothetical protein